MTGSPLLARQRPGRPTLLSGPVVIAEWWKNRGGDSVRLTLTAFKGRNVLDLRIRLKERCFVHGRVHDVGEIVMLPEGMAGPHRTVHRSVDRIDYRTNPAVDANRLLGETIDVPLYDVMPDEPESHSEAQRAEADRAAHERELNLANRKVSEAEIAAAPLAARLAQILSKADSDDKSIDQALRDAVAFVSRTVQSGVRLHTLRQAVVHNGAGTANEHARAFLDRLLTDEGWLAAYGDNCER